MTSFVTPTALPHERLQARRRCSCHACPSTTTMIAPNVRDKTKVGSDGEQPRDGQETTDKSGYHIGAMISNVCASIVRALTPGSNAEVHVLRVRSPVPLRIALASGVRDIAEGETLIQFRAEKDAIHTGWLVQDAALKEGVGMEDMDMLVSYASTGDSWVVGRERTLPKRNLADMDPAYFLPHALPPDEDDLTDWMRNAHWEDTAMTRHICDITPGPNEDTKLDEEWLETVGKLTMLQVEQIDKECRLCGGTGKNKCSRCGGAAAMALPGSSFRCVCRGGYVPCCWCAGDGIPR